jgi:hypothetical protein
MSTTVTPRMVAAKGQMAIPAPGTIGHRLQMAPYGVTLGLALQATRGKRKGHVMTVREDDNLG